MRPFVLNRAVDQLFCRALGLDSEAHQPSVPGELIYARESLWQAHARGSGLSSDDLTWVVVVS